MPSRTPVAMNHRVTLHLALSLGDGTEVMSTFGGEPLDVVLGDGTLARGIELALLGQRPGQEQRVEIAPELAFGLRDPRRTAKLPRSAFPEPDRLEPGMVTEVALPEAGGSQAARIVAIDPDEVTLDLNHPLAGQAVILHSHVIAVGEDER